MSDTSGTASYPCARTIFGGILRPFSKLTGLSDLLGLVGSKCDASYNRWARMQRQYIWTGHTRTGEQTCRPVGFHSGLDDSNI